MMGDPCNKQNIAYLSLGSNIDDREKHLLDAIKLLEKDANIVLHAKSSIYETEPVGYIDQQSFLNMTVKVGTSYTPLQLLEVTQKIEDSGGRKRSVRFGPRTIDLDILLYNHENIKLEQLEIPHPRMLERAFVIAPLLEIEPHLQIREGELLTDNIDIFKYKEGVRRWKSLFGGDVFDPSES